MTVAVAEATEAFQTVMEQTSFGPALWAAMQFDEVGRMACAGGQSQGDDERSQAVAGMARAELGAGRILALTDLELAMLRAHAAAPVVGPARAELLRRHPQLTPMTNDSIKAAKKAFSEDDGGGRGTADFRQGPKAEDKYGPVGLWDVSEVTGMNHLLYGCKNFNEDISAWDLRRAEDVRFMFCAASIELELQPAARSVGYSPGRGPELHVRRSLELQPTARRVGHSCSAVPRASTSCSECGWFARARTRTACSSAPPPSSCRRTRRGTRDRAGRDRGGGRGERGVRVAGARKRCSKQTQLKYKSLFDVEE